MPVVAERIPASWFCRLIDSTYPRFEPEIRPVVAACDPDGVAVDIGAWYGPWTRRLAGRVRRVVSFEANAKVADALARVIPANVTLHRSAVSDHVGTVTFVADGVGRGDEGTSRVVDGAGAEGGVEVTATTLDAVGVEDVRFVKIDVEGHELAVLRGARATLETWHPVLVVEIESRMSDVDATLTHLADLGYAGRVLHDGAWRSLDDIDLVAEQARAEPPASYLGTVVKGRTGYPNNVVFVHPESTWAPW